MKIPKSLATILLLALVALCNLAFGGELVKVGSGVELYYEDVGQGAPLVLVPGWQCTTEFFTHQISYFSENFRVLSYDPRSHGRSSKTPENNHYTQHGEDLKAFLDALDLEDVILVGWSWGCHDAYAYFRKYGTENIEAFVCIDQTPKSLATQEGDWAEFSDGLEVGRVLQDTLYDRRRLMASLLPSCLTREMTEKELTWALDQVEKTPTYAAALLAADGAFADYSEEARMVDGKIPVLNFISKDRAESATAWLKKNAPNSEVVVLGKHMMFWEFADEFNAALDQFLGTLK